MMNGMMGNAMMGMGRLFLLKARAEAADKS